MVVQARCHEAERSLFLQPLAEAVRAAAMALPPARVGAAAGDAAATLAELVPDLRRLLALEGYERAPAELERRRSFEAVTAFPRRLAGDRLLLLAAVRAEEGAETLEALADVARVLELGAPAGGGRGRAGAPLRRGRPGRPGRSGPAATPCSRWRACGPPPRPAATGTPCRPRCGTVSARARRAGPEVETLLRAAVVAGANVDLE